MRLEISAHVAHREHGFVALGLVQTDDRLEDFALRFVAEDSQGSEAGNAGWTSQQARLGYGNQRRAEPIAGFIEHVTAQINAIGIDAQSGEIRKVAVHRISHSGKPAPGLGRIGARGNGNEKAIADDIVGIDIDGRGEPPL